MTLERALALMRIEQQCVMRNDKGKCNRDCAKCDLVQPTQDLIAAYDKIITALLLNTDVQ